jgi:small ligand-binding sensory domain FIST
MRWASAVDTDTSLRAAVEHAAETVFLGLGRQEPDLAIVFVSAEHAAHFDAVPTLLKREFENVFMVGCSGGGVIGGGREIEDRPAFSLTGAVLPGVRMKGTHLDAAQVPPVYAEARVWEDALRITASQQPSFLLLADPFSFEAETFIRGLDRIYPLAPKIGGLASGARQVGGNVLYLGNQVYHSGCVALALTGNIDIDMVIAQGCRPIGDPMFVTSAHENLIRELDGRSPRDVLSALFERLPASDRELFGHSLHLGMAMRTDTSEFAPGDFLIRSILGMDPQSGALWVSANVPANSVVQFHLRDAATSAIDLERTLITYRASHEIPPDAGALLFSCHGRGISLYGQADHDCNAFRRLVADLPIGGVFCDGEFGPIQNSTFLHSHTSAFAVIHEKK